MLSPKPRTQTMLPLQVRDLCFSAGGHRLIDALSLTVQSGRLTVVMGANGAGKSLLLRLLHGLLPMESGTVEWAGVPVGAATLARQAMVFQRPVLLRRTVQANLDFVLGLRSGVSRAQRRQFSEHLLRKVGLDDRAGQPARLLSGGEQQRLALARALATQPELLLLDEATASLDPASVQIIESIVQDCREEGVGVILVTHDIGQARRLADDIVFLHQGKLAESSPAKAFFDNPTSAPARAYLAGELYV
ncbi:MAG: ATP-binding cassette domain-containing protein [Burkholderiaceae bacterium]